MHPSASRLSVWGRAVACSDMQVQDQVLYLLAQRIGVGMCHVGSKKSMIYGDSGWYVCHLSGGFGSSFICGIMV